MPDSSASGVRLQKFLASAGVASRRMAEELIQNGEVKVNGRPAELGQRIDPARDQVVVRGKLIQQESAAAMTLAMHKPRGYLCSHGDPHHEKTIYHLLPKELAARRFLCAGRLDLESEGLLILTTDGELANRLMHPGSLVVKRYQVRLNKPFAHAKIPLLLKGIEYEGEHLQVEKAIPFRQDRGEESADWEVHLHHGKKREIRRLFEVLGYRVKRLRRFQIGRFSLRRIPTGRSKILTQREIALLFQADETDSPRENNAFF
jgi:23S rRNA pseudouridine2605 synthase